MGKRNSIVVLVLLFLAIPVGVVNAQQDQTDPARLEREKRISERKSRIQANLTDAQKNSLKTRCVGAQTKLDAHLTNAQKFSEQNDKKMDQLVEKINNLAKRLKENGRDTSSLDQLLPLVTEKNNELKTYYEKYISALTDAKQLDCKADPVGFRSSVDEAKTAFAELNAARIDTKKTIKEDIVNALKAIVIKGEE